MVGGCGGFARTDGNWMKKKALTLEWLIWHECVTYVYIQDEPCDLAI